MLSVEKHEGDSGAALLAWFGTVEIVATVARERKPSFLLLDEGKLHLLDPVRVNRAIYLEVNEFYVWHKRHLPFLERILPQDPGESKV